MLRTIMYVYCALHACITCITGEKGIEPLSVVLETTVLPIKLFSRCVVYNACIHQINTYHLCVRMLRTIMYVYYALHAQQSVYNDYLHCVYNICIVCTIGKTVLLTAVLPYCRIAILPYHAQCANILYTHMHCITCMILCCALHA